MKPHSLSSAQLTPRAIEPSLYEKRFGKYAKGTILPETQVPACPRVKVKDLPKGFIPPRMYERNLEQNQQVASCCRHPEDHEIEARKSHPDEKLPDIYIFHCTGCGRKHRVFMVGMTDAEPRPIWDAS
jgi:hypothetical protein